MIRLGHPARISDVNLKNFSLDSLLFHSDSAEILKEIRTEIDGIFGRLKFAKNDGDRIRIRSDLRQLRKEFSDRETKAMRSAIENCSIIAATLTSANPGGPLRHVKKPFDLVIIDECAQALEVACWIALLQVKVLSGV